jgi:hypothetical protein
MSLSAHPESTFQKLLTLDTIALSAHLAVIITTDHKCDDILSKTGAGAQSLLNLLQAVCSYNMLFMFHS